MAVTTPKEFALQVDSDARTVRKFLRDITPKDEHPGKGSRWAIENKSIRSLKTKFSKWDEERKAAESDDTPEDA